MRKTIKKKSIFNRFKFDAPLIWRQLFVFFKQINIENRNVSNLHIYYVY